MTPLSPTLSAPHFSRQIGKPFQVFINSTTIGSAWFNTKHIAQMSGTDLLRIRNMPCCCSAYADVDKQDGHLLTTNCGILPSQSLTQLGRMDAKHLPHDCPSHLNSETRSDILSVLQSAVSRFAREAETRVTQPGCMRPWQSEVDNRLAAAVAAIPDGTLLTPVGALPYSPSDSKLMSIFLRNFVCTPMDKACSKRVRPLSSCQLQSTLCACQTLQGCRHLCLSVPQSVLQRHFE